MPRIGNPAERLPAVTVFGVSFLSIWVASAPVSHAQAVAQNQGEQAEEVIEEVIVTGSRRPARSAADTPAPVDVIGGESFRDQGDSDIPDMLRTLVPSYNVGQQPISDAATLIRPATLRGLPPDQTLVLVNGKRWHRAAVITFLGQGLSDGAQGPDISVIPSIGLERVEVLRDGAAAQYGSDAIAGVINFILKDDAEGLTLEAKWGSTYEGDGDEFQLAGNIGLPVTDRGFVNFSAEYRTVDPTSRSVQRDDAAALIAAGNTAVADPAQIWGQPKVRDDIKLFMNFGIEAADNIEAYAFGNYAEREVEGGFFFRNPNTRGGVFSNDGGITRLVGDLTPDDGQTCPVIVIGAPDEQMLLQQVFDDPNCFVFNELFSGGFTPRFGGNLNDIAGFMGVRGDLDMGLHFDISIGAGRNEIDFFINNTVNASLGPATPTSFRLGSYVQLEKNFNVDLTYPLPVSFFASDLNIAGGFEWREEQWEAQVGQPESFVAGPLAEQGFTIGANGFPGFSPNVAGTFDRTNIAFYLDLEADVVEGFVLNVAGRVEDFSDFGTTANGKFAFLWYVTDFLRLRGGYNSGFRAPTPGQSHVTNISTVFEGGRLINRGTIPPTNPIAQLRGGKPLEPEKSDGFTAGFALDVGPMTMTVDYFNIKVKDRIAQSASQTITPEEAQMLEEQGITGASDISVFRFFTNDFDTRTQGVDIVATYPFDLLEGANELSLSFNWTKTKVTKFTPGVVDETRIRQLEDALPAVRGNLTYTYSREKWRVLLRANYYGKSFEAHLDDITLPINLKRQVTFDAEVSYDLTSHVALLVGADNVFNNFPTKNPWAGIAGAKYPETSPFGFNGGFYYIRLRYSR